MVTYDQSYDCTYKIREPVLEGVSCGVLEMVLKEEIVSIGEE